MSEGVRTLHSVREGDSHRSEGDVGEAVAEGVEERRQGDVLDEGVVRLLIWHELGRPEHPHHQEPNNKMDNRHEPGMKQIDFTTGLSSDCAIRLGWGRERLGLLNC